ncbi:MAG: Rid family detoxifying hydrolase, partial [Gemmatimonadetes bacterium]|nr:Rid family detoxifying hydrolase [Gemmatimonadota bacterium]
MSDLEYVHTDEAPAAIGPYSQAIVVDGWVFCSGQIPIDPESGELSTGSVADQTDLALRNLTAVLQQAGSSLKSVVKTTVFLSDMGTFAEMNGVYAEHFG